MIHHSRASTLQSLSLFITLIAAGSVLAVQGGTLDGTFGSGGKTTTNVSTFALDFTRRVFTLPGGKILVVGQSSITLPGMHAEWPVLARYNSDGSLDSTFGTGGEVVDNNTSIRVLDTLVQPDGKIVVCGGHVSNGNVLFNFDLVRYNADGSRDTGFGSGGLASVDFGSGFGGVSAAAAALALLSGGKILAVGSNPGDGLGTPSQIRMARFNSDGTLDATFGTAGLRSHPYGDFTSNARVTDMAVLPDGRFLIKGSAFVAQFNADGSADSSFSGDGISPTSDATSVLLQPDGKFIVYGNDPYPTAPQPFLLTRYLSDGNVDGSFGEAGTARAYFRGTPGHYALASITDLALRGDGEIFAIGSARLDNNAATTASFALAEFSPSGAVRAKTLLSFGTDARGASVAIQPDGKIIAAGSRQVSPNDIEIALARFTAITNDVRAFKRNYDFNGDGRDDITVYRVDTGSGPSHWYSSSYNYPWFTFGTNGDIIAPADYDDDGVVNLAVFRPSNGYWYIANSLTNAATDFRAVQWGASGDIPVAGDYDGDNRADIAVFRPSTGVWYILGSQNGPSAVQWGQAGDKPVVGDYDGDGKADMAVYRPSEGAWYVLRSSDGQMRASIFGAAADLPVQGDYDGDGTTDVAVFRPSDGIWYYINSSTNSFAAQYWGSTGDVPAPGDYDGDGKSDFAVVRPESDKGFWYILRSTDGTMQSLQWGLSTDTVVPGK